MSLSMSGLCEKVLLAIGQGSYLTPALGFYINLLNLSNFNIDLVWTVEKCVHLFTSVLSE